MLAFQVQAFGHPLSPYTSRVFSTVAGKMNKLIRVCACVYFYSNRLSMHCWVGWLQQTVEMGLASPEETRYLTQAHYTQ